MGGTSDRLKERASRRTEWIESAAKRFEADPSVAAAWLFGSEGRGDADELSDVDLIVALVDKDEAALAERLAAVEGDFADLGDVVGVVERPERALPGGRSFVVSYPAPVEPLRVV